MSNVETDDEPVTKRDFRELEEELDRRFSRVDERMATFATREELHEGLSLVINRFDARMSQLATELKQYVHDVVNKVVNDVVSSQVRASEERLRDYLGAIDDKYKDLPPRVSRLEATVFPPEPPAKRQRRR